MSGSLLQLRQEINTFTEGDESIFEYMYFKFAGEKKSPTFAKPLRYSDSVSLPVITADLDSECWFYQPRTFFLLLCIKTHVPPR